MRLPSPATRPHSLTDGCAQAIRAPKVEVFNFLLAHNGSDYNHGKYSGWATHEADAVYHVAVEFGRCPFQGETLRVDVTPLGDAGRRGEVLHDALEMAFRKARDLNCEGDAVYTDRPQPETVMLRFVPEAK